MEAILEALKQNSLPEDLSFKSLFKATTENLSHSNKELRETAMALIREVFRYVQDDINTIMANLTHLKPV